MDAPSGFPWDVIYWGNFGDTMPVPVGVFLVGRPGRRGELLEDLGSRYWVRFQVPLVQGGDKGFRA